MEVQWSQSQRDRLKWAARHARPPYIRVKALAILNVAEGGRIIRVARTFRVSRQTLGDWCQRFAREGLDGLRVRAGRDGAEGRRPIRRKWSGTCASRPGNSGFRRPVGP